MTTLTWLVGLAVIAAVAWAVASPLWGVAAAPVDVGPIDPERRRLEKERDLAYAAIKEAEFDFQMGKLSSEDYAALRGTYEARAIAALAALERRR